jgi:GH35 family endo-1,4-beta-xylanase
MPAILVLGALACSCSNAVAEGVLDTYRKLWSDPAVERRIAEGIERNRKGDAVITLVDAAGKPVSGAVVEVRHVRHEFLFGCNAFVLGQMGENNQKYEETFVRLFNFASVPFYWEGTEPTQGELRYTEAARDIWRRPPPDRFIAFGKKFGLTLKGHPLLWHGCNPAWLPKDPEELKKLYQKRFREIAERYAKDIRVWDVVNESQVCPKEYPLFSPGKEYVGWAFREACPLFQPENLMMINEVTAFNRGVGEENPYYRQVKQLIADGAAVEGIGFQFHLFNGQALTGHLQGRAFPPAELLDVYDSFGDFDRPLFVTEITVPTTVEDGEAVQAEVIGNLYRLWFSAPRMAGITYWNLPDGTAYKDENKANAGLVDKDLRPKASYEALDRLINRDWRTNLTATTDAEGKIQFRGFFGKYSVRVQVGNASKEFEVDLSREGRSGHELTWAP